MMYKEFKVEVSKTLAAKVCISKEDLHALGVSTSEVVEEFLKSNPEYKSCTSDADFNNGVWTISFYTTSEVVFKEV